MKPLETDVTVTLPVRDWIGVRLALMGVIFEAERPTTSASIKKINNEIKPCYQAILDRVTEQVFSSKREAMPNT